MELESFNSLGEIAKEGYQGLIVDKEEGNRVRYSIGGRSFRGLSEFSEHIQGFNLNDVETLNIPKQYSSLEVDKKYSVLVKSLLLGRYAVKNVLIDNELYENNNPLNWYLSVKWGWTKERMYRKRGERIYCFYGPEKMLDLYTNENLEVVLKKIEKNNRINHLEKSLRKGIRRLLRMFYAKKQDYSEKGAEYAIQLFPQNNLGRIPGKDYAENPGNPFWMEHMIRNPDDFKNILKEAGLYSEKIYSNIRKKVKIHLLSQTIAKKHDESSKRAFNACPQKIVYTDYKPVEMTL